VFPERHMQYIAALQPHASHRTNVNAAYAGRSRNDVDLAVKADPALAEPLAWLLEKRYGRNEIWVELGRFDDPDDLLACALHLCEVKPATVKEGAATARRWRLGQQGGGDPNQLANAILAEIYRYTRQHWVVDPQVIMDALALAAEQYADV
jgi:hypothetical protein